MDEEGKLRKAVCLGQEVISNNILNIRFLRLLSTPCCLPFYILTLNTYTYYLLLTLPSIQGLYVGLIKKIKILALFYLFKYILNQLQKSIVYILKKSNGPMVEGAFTAYQGRAIC